MTPAGIEPATFQFVAQHLNHCATAVPIYIYIYIYIYGEMGRIQRRLSKQGILMRGRGPVGGEEPRNFLSLHFVIRPFGVEQQC